MGRNGNGRNYAAIDRTDVPQGRKGKHRKAVADILADLGKLTAQQAVKIPLSSLEDEKMQNLRSALNRVTREKNIPVETSSDEKFFYVWRADAPPSTGATE
jgi:antitoxin component of RelBE/YafQ-DinJ toxin-antitoxin module